VVERRPQQNGRRYHFGDKQSAQVHAGRLTVRIQNDRLNTFLNTAFTNEGHPGRENKPGGQYVYIGSLKLTASISSSPYTASQDQ
jgi:hypothetical protein